MSETHNHPLEHGETGKSAARRPPPHLFWPVVLITVGAVLLLANLGLLPEPSWVVLWQLWPLLLIALGVEVLIGRRSTLGAIFSALVLVVLLVAAFGLVFYAPNIPALSALVQEQSWKTQHVEYPLAGVDRAKVELDWTSVPGDVRALAGSDNLIEADVDYVGELIFDVDAATDGARVILDSRSSGPQGWLWPAASDDARWDVRLSPEVELELVLDASSGYGSFDLRGLQISALTLDASSGAIDMMLPAGSSFEAHVDGSSGALTLTVPEDVGVRVTLDGGSGAFHAGERFRLVEGEVQGDGVWETDGLAAAADTIELTIDQSSGAITIR